MSTMNSPTDSRRSSNAGSIAIIRVLPPGAPGFAAPCQQRIDLRLWLPDVETGLRVRRGREERARTDGARATWNRGDLPRATIPLASAACGRVPVLRSRELRRRRRA